MTADELAELVACHAPSLVVHDLDACVAELAAALAAARAGESIDATLEQFARAAVVCAPEGVALDDHLGALPEPLLLVTACAAGDSRAVGEFERRYFRALRPALARMKLDDDRIAEVTQLVRHKLFVTDESGHSPLLGYVGKGDLVSFVRVVATRTALDLLRKKQPETPSEHDPLLDVASPTDTPQMRLLKAKYKHEFKQAFERAMATLNAHERNVLRMSLVDGLSIDEIGGFYRIHRATAARRLARARARLAELTRDELHKSLTLDEGEFTHIIKLVHSQLDLSITRILGD